MKIINGIELSEITFYFMEETTAQRGILVHDPADKNHDGDAIFGNGWTLDVLNDTHDLENLLSDTCGTTYFHQNDDGTYTIEA